MVKNRASRFLVSIPAEELASLLLAFPGEDGDCPQKAVRLQEQLPVGRRGGRSHFFWGVWTLL
jgi:hypothetical protein